jgi:hypothetical protein
VPSVRARVPDGRRIVTRVALFALPALLAVALVGDAAAHEGYPCWRSTQCDTARHELCVADTVTSTSGTCRRLKVLP